MEEIKTGIAAFFMICCIVCSPADFIYAANNESVASEQITDAKNGIVEIQAGFCAESGKFYQMKHSSGFLVCNSKEKGIYIVTNTSKVTLSAKQKKKYCKKHKIKSDNQQEFETVLRVIVDGDVTEELTMLSSSKEQDICILESENVLQTKKALPLEDQQKTEIGDSVYVMGFSESSTNDYTAESVEIHGGEVEDPAARIKQDSYIQHTAIVNEDNSGGPLLYQNGYVIGINTAKKNTKGIANGYALPVGELLELLDNYGIFYDSHERQNVYDKLMDYCSLCEKKVNSNAYRDVSMETLEEAIKEVKLMLNAENEYSIEEYEDTIELLKNGEKELVKKTSKLRIASIVLGVIIGGLGIWLVILLIHMKHKKEMKTNLREEADTEKDREEQIVIHRVLPVSENNIANSALVFHEREASNISSDVYQEDEEKTMLLGSGYRPYEAFLRSTSNKQQILINKQQVIIGKSADIADCVIKENIAISREHAKICWSNGAYYLYDLHSANGTFLNGKRVDDRGVKLTEGDKIVFANEMFEFKIKREV